MSVDAVLHEAKQVLANYTTPARELVKQGLHGPREARLAGAVVALAEKHEEDATDQINVLVRLLRSASAILYKRCVGVESLIDQIDEAISEAEANWLHAGCQGDAVTSDS